jgi:hypothetical protein
MPKQIHDILTRKIREQAKLPLRVGLRISKCHQAEVSISTDGTKHFYQYKGCGKPCEVWSTDLTLTNV